MTYTLDSDDIEILQTLATFYDGKATRAHLLDRLAQGNPQRWEHFAGRLIGRSFPLRLMRLWEQDQGYLKLTPQGRLTLRQTQGEHAYAM